MAADLEIRIAAEFTEVKAALAALKKDLGGVGDAARKAGQQSGALSKIESSVTGAATAIKGLVAGFAALASIKAVVGLADEIATLNARLQLASRSTDEFVRAQDELFGLAQRTRSGLKDTIDLYTRLAQSTKETGVTQSQLLGITETVNQAIQLSGVSAQAAQAALVQFGQGLSSGALRGEELNSILEQASGLADAIAKGLGVTRGELRSLGEQGKLTSEALIGALGKVAPQVRKDFESLPLTVGQAFTKLSNSFTKLVGVFDEASAGTKGLAGIVNDLAELVSSDAFTGGVRELATVWGAGFRAIADDAQRAISTIREATRNFLGSGTDIFGFLFRAIRDFPVNVRAAIQIAVVSFAAMIDVFVAQARFLRDAIVALFTDDTIADAMDRRNRAMNAALTTAREMSAEIATNAERQKKALVDQIALEQQRRAAARQRAIENEAAAAAASKRTGGVRGVVDPFEVRKEAAKGALKELEEIYRDGNIALEAYLRRRVELQLQAIDAEIAAERKKLAEAEKAKKQEDANKAATKVAVLENERTAVVIDAERDRAREIRKFEQERTELRAKQLEQQGQLEQAALLRLRAQYADTLRRMQTEGDEAGVKLIEGIINTEAARARMQELQKEVERVQGTLEARLQSVADQRSTGAISGDAAASAQSEARRAAIEELTALNAQFVELAARTNDPEIARGAAAVAESLARIRRDGLEGTDLAIANLTASLDNMKRTFASTVADTAVSSIEDLFMSIIDGSKTAGEALRDFVAGFARQMAAIAVRALATYAVLQLLDAVYPGLGRAAAAGMGANVKHSGGMVGSGPRRNVPALLFAGAPRFHSGGMVGLKSDEVPAILQTGEEVLSRNDPRNAANGGQTGVRIVNAVDPNLVGDYMQSSSGERTIVNLIQRNRGQIKQIIG